MNELLEMIGYIWPFQNPYDEYQKAKSHLENTDCDDFEAISNLVKYTGPIASVHNISLEMLVVAFERIYNATKELSISQNEIEVALYIRKILAIHYSQ